MLMIIIIEAQQSAAGAACGVYPPHTLGLNSGPARAMLSEIYEAQ